MAARLLLLAFFAMAAASLAIATDPTQLQDFCVADENSQVFVNGLTCKDPKQVKADDFFFRGLDKPGNTANRVGSKVTQVSVKQLPGLNSLGVSMARVDYAPYGLNTLHTHPRATEILTVLEGSLYVGFVTSNPDNKLITKVLKKGDVFVFPQGLICFQFNYGKKKAVGLAVFSSQNPGMVTVADAVFGSEPRISEHILSKAFQVDKKIAKLLQAKFRKGSSY